ncbi:hypothetical protein D6D15_08826 [Aureobasidium pullulans]|uniref:HMG box domain-containing protein n=1 Tax=Aureobasidium pullulans TaxID=5580 RepID=A0A4V4IU80_AURPU|nr:hypothetical protein D6D15_08826 [Aureobasidium pullulans]
MASVSTFPLMSTQQQEIEKTWYQAMIQIASATGNTQIILPSDLKGRLGHDGIAAIAQRCSTFSNAQVEVKDNALTDTIHINVMSPGSHSQSDETAMSSPASPSPESPDSSKKGAKVSRPANAFILYRKHHHSDTVARNPGLHNNEISKIIGKMWRDESEPVKKQWKDQAESVKRQHIRDHPDYQYQPRKPHEKKRRMTKRKAMALAAQQVIPSSSASVSTAVPAVSVNTAGTINTFSPVAPTVGPFSSVTSPSQIVDLSNYDDPLLGYSSNGDLASFTLDTFESNQLDLFSNLLEEHNIDYEYGPASLLAPGASTSLPTTLNHAMADGNNGASLIDPNLTTNDFTMAQTDLNTFESSLEDMLARELENMDGDGADSADNGFQYNDLESLRFTEFLEQMPEHMWGMEFVN